MYGRYIIDTGERMDIINCYFPGRPPSRHSRHRALSSSDYSVKKKNKTKQNNRKPGDPAAPGFIRSRSRFSSSPESSTIEKGQFSLRASGPLSLLLFRFFFFTSTPS